MESADENLVGKLSDFGADTLPHLVSSLVGKRSAKDIAGMDLMLFNEMDDALSQNAGLTTARDGSNDAWTFEMFYCFFLFRI